jgi:hypothetical protein
MFLSWEFCGDDVNGEDRRRKVAFLLLALAAAMAVASAAFAVEIRLDSSDVARIGATPQVRVYCPVAGDPCQITRVTWSVAFSPPPPKVTAVNIQWTPAATGTYTVYVVLYRSDGTTVEGYGSTSVTISTLGSTPTTVNLASPADPRYIYYVEIAIVQTAFSS